MATGQGQLIEVQLSGEAGPFPAAELGRMQELALRGLARLSRLQAETLAPWLPLPW